MDKVKVIFRKDRDGKEFKRYASGIHDTTEMFKRYIDMNKNRIMVEC